LRWDDATQRYYKRTPGEKRTPPPLPPPPPPPPPRPRLPGVLELLRLHETLGCRPAAPLRRLAASSATIAAWCDERGGESDGALLPLSLGGDAVLLAGGLRTGALRALSVCPVDPPDSEDDSPEPPPWRPPQLLLEDRLQRRSQLRSAMLLRAGRASARLAVAWLGGGDSPGTLGVCLLKRKARSGALRLTERGSAALRWGSLWCAAADEAGESAALGGSGSLTRVDLSTAAQTQVLSALGSDVLSVALAPGGAWLAGLRSGSVLLADPREADGDGVPLFSVGRAAVTALSLSPRQPFLALAAASDGSLCGWDVRFAPRGPVSTFSTGSNAVSNLLHRHCVDEHGQLLAAPGADGSLRLWALNPCTSAPLATLPPVEVRGSGLVSFTAATFQPRSAGGDATLRLWMGSHEGLALVQSQSIASGFPAARVDLLPQIRLWQPS